MLNCQELRVASLVVPCHCEQLDVCDALYNSSKDTHGSISQKINVELGWGDQIRAALVRQRVAD